MTGVVVSYPGVMQHAQQIARAFHEVGVLDRLVTAFAPNPERFPGRLLAGAERGVAAAARRRLDRRKINQVPYTLVQDIGAGEVMRLAASATFKDARVADTIWDLASHHFDRRVAQRHARRGPVEALHAFEYTALHTFEEAKRAGKLCVLHLPSLDSREFENMQRRELSSWPELANPHQAYFDRRFERRNERRSRERELADVIVCNSALTARSHAAAGADPGKIVVTPLGAPPPLLASELFYRSPSEPLSVVWAGPFSLRKGAHHFLTAWRLLNAGPAAEAHIYGSIALPPRALLMAADTVTFHGPVSQQVLFSAFRQADILVFPSLSDGFGMVLTEALSQGLPVLTTAAAGASELIRPRCNGVMVPAGDPHALKEAMQWCLDNRDALQSMKTEALKTAEGSQWSHFRKRVRDLTLSANGDRGGAMHLTELRP